MMACADTAMALAICSTFGEPRNITTVGQTISFMRPVAQDLVIEASVQKRGRNLIFGEALFMAHGTKALTAHATATWAVIP
jgi:acyl-coenzyme A thioesterase PaaI-like protein